MRREYNPNAAVESTSFGANPTNPIYLNYFLFRLDGGSITANDLFIDIRLTAYS